MAALGIDGYALKGEENKMLVEAIRTVAGGGTWFNQGIVKKLVQYFSL